MSATQPSALSAPALYLSNWSDLVAIWMASSRAQTDDQKAGPRLGELHLLDGPPEARGVNQIVDHTGFFRDETRGIAYTDAHQFASEAWFESDSGNAGTLTTRYVTYAGQPLNLEIRRSYVAVPGQPFFVVRYTITNRGPTVDFNVFDQLHLANIGGTDPNRQVHAWYDADRNALVADMTASGQFVVVLGAFDAMDSHQVGNDADRAASSPTASGWACFQASGALPNNGDLRASDVDLGFQKRMTIASGTTASISFYLTLRVHLEAALAASDVARAKPASSWFDATAASYVSWLANAGRGVDVAFDDDGINQAFRRSLILIKNAQNPVLGTVPAATNPFAYGHKTWVRDASIAAIALDASGHAEEAALYWRWMAGVQANSGAWKTTYNAWDGSYLAFVEPEDDSIGTFLYGVCRHYMRTGDPVFLRDLWPAVQLAADSILTNLAPNGFGPADYSIWEESSRGLEHNTYTQSWYVLGLCATQYLAEVRGDTDLADWYAGGPASIMTAFQRPDDNGPPGMWNSQGGYYNRSVRVENIVQPLVDSSSNVVVAFEVVDPHSERAQRHVEKTTSMLGCSQWGLSRYANDSYYYSDPYDPAGDESLAPSPAWPQMSMWVAAYENAVGSPNALARLQWFVRTMGVGYTPQGEAVSNVTGQSVLSSMCEPLTASSFILAALCLQGRYALSLVPPIYNAGARKAIAIHFGTSGDWAQWSNVPYFIAPATRHPKATALTSVRRVYVANDERCIYVRIDNVGGWLPQYAQEPLFVIRVYGGDFAHGPVESVKSAADGTPLPRAASFMAERRSDRDAYSHWRIVAGVWTQTGTIADAIAPQWDPTLGRIEAAIPIWTMSSSSSSPVGSWAHICIAMGVVSPDGSVEEIHRVPIHYRLSGGEQAWIYGNIEM